ncbi:MAG: hypothetical protein ACRC62_12570 [Microcoleus sp.]
MFSSTGAIVAVIRSRVDCIWVVVKFARVNHIEGRRKREEGRRKREEGRRSKVIY